MPDAFKTILYIDDKDSCEMLSLFLGFKGYIVKTANTAEEGLRLALKNRYASIILETWLPDISGIDLCQRIRKFDSHTPIIFFSTNSIEKDRQAGLRAGGQRYLVKPSDLLTIADTLDQITQKSSFAVVRG